MKFVQLQRAGVIKSVPAHEVDRLLRAGYSKVEAPKVEETIEQPSEVKKSTRKKATLPEPEE